jgi:hypothetical protein
MALDVTAEWCEGWRRIYTTGRYSSFLRKGDMATKAISSSDLIWIFHEKLREYGDHPFHGIRLAVVRGDNGDWKVITQRKLPSRKPDMATRISTIERQLRKHYRLAAE